MREMSALERRGEDGSLTVWPGENHQVWCLQMPGAVEDLTGGDSPLS